LTKRAQNALFLCAIALWVGAPRSAAAQALKGWDLFGGYAYLRDAPQDLNFPVGWSASASARLSRWFSVVGEAGGSHKTIALVGGDLNVTARAVMAGGRASFAVGRLVEFVQLVAGPLRTHGTAFGLASSDTHMAAQGSIGLDIPLRPPIAARIQFDGRFLETGHEIRAVAGIVFARR
jgi:hypothetical protein